MSEMKRGCYYCANRNKFNCKIRKKNWGSLFNGLIKNEKDILKYNLGTKCRQFEPKKVKVLLV